MHSRLNFAARDLPTSDPLSAAEGGPGANRYSRLLLRKFPDAPIERLWREFLNRVDCPAHYDSPDYFLEPYWKDENPFAVLLFRDHRAVGALTGLDQGWQMMSGRASRPQICVAKDEDTHLLTQALADALTAYFPNAKLFTVYGWSTVALPGLADRGFRQVPLEGDVVLDLGPGAKAIFNTLTKCRRNIRTAIRNGIEVTEATTEEDVEAYWRLYLSWKQTDRKKIHHNREYAMLAAVQQMRNNHRRFLARYKGEVIAATGVRFYPGGLVEYANNCSRDEYLPLRPNDLLMWRVIEWACEQGFPRLSMGGAHTFLRKWSDTVIPIHRYRLDRTFLHSVELKEEAAAQVRKLTRRLPAPVQGALKSLLRYGS